LRIPTRKGMSPERQEGFQIASQLKSVKYIVWLEPEKVDMVRLVPDLVKPLVNNEADISLPSRNIESFDSYPSYQADFERRSNELWNNFLKSRGLLDESVNQDAWFGPRAFKNNKTTLSFFLQQFQFQKRPDVKLDALLNPNAYANAIFFPLISALKKGKRIANIEMELGKEYKHPEIQTQIEQDSPEFQRKRQMQQRQLIVLEKHFLDYLSPSKSRQSRSRISV
jgi:hypothetical protein